MPSDIDDGSLQLEIIDTQASPYLKHAPGKEGFTKFWTKCIYVDKFPNKKKLSNVSDGCIYTFSTKCMVLTKKMLREFQQVLIPK